MPPEPPYLIVPRIGADLDRGALLEGFPDAANTTLVYPKDMPPALSAPIGGDVAIGLVRATEWLLALTPRRLAEVSAWIVGTYGAREFAKGFAGEAGKDTWEAVTAQEGEWVSFKGFSHLRSWLWVPLVASQRVLGFLSLGDTRGHTFTHEHLRLAKSLAIPAAVAIQNARLYEQAEIFRGELEQRLAELQQADEALGKIRQSRQLS